jgi:hypothetical protein
MLRKFSKCLGESKESEPMLRKISKRPRVIPGRGSFLAITLGPKALYQSKIILEDDVDLPTNINKDPLLVPNGSITRTF